MSIFSGALRTISRRQLLQAGGLGMVTAGFPKILSAGPNGARQIRPTEKSCIFILLCGGPSHLDTWDLKPGAPEEIRGPYKPAATSVPGMRISELHSRLPQLAKHFSLIRSMSHPGNISNHFDAMHNLLSGQAGAPSDSPYLGSILAKMRPSHRNIASYVWLIKCIGDPVFCAPNLATGGNLGLAYAPLFVGTADNNPSTPNFKPPDVFEMTEPLCMRNRRHLLASLDQQAGVSNGHAAGKQWLDVHEHAFDLATSAKARQAFEMDRECPKVRDRFGRHPLGQNLLLARRLVEAGVGFVTVNGWAGISPSEKLGGPPSSSWDMHGGEMGMGNAFGSGSFGMGWCLPRLDEALGALLTDLQERGMLDNTLVVVTGEFGRTPNINARASSNPGRQHWPFCYSSILAGGGIRGGQVYGESDKNGAYVKDKPVRPQDLAATIYHSLGVTLDARMTKDGALRPMTAGEPLLSLFG